MLAALRRAEPHGYGAAGTEVYMIGLWTFRLLQPEALCKEGVRSFVLSLLNLTHPWTFLNSPLGSAVALSAGAEPQAGVSRPRRSPFVQQYKIIIQNLEAARSLLVLYSYVHYSDFGGTKNVTSVIYHGLKHRSWLVFLLDFSLYLFLAQMEQVYLFLGFYPFLYLVSACVTAVWTNPASLLLSVQRTAYRIRTVCGVPGGRASRLSCVRANEFVLVVFS